MAALGVTPTCRRCGEELSPRAQRSFLAGKRVKCPNCDWYGNWRHNTPLARSTISNLQFLALFYKFSLPDEVPDIAVTLGLSPTTIREWRGRIQAMMEGRHG